MAKVERAEVEGSAPLGQIRVQIKGLEPEYGNDGFFILSGVRLAEVEWRKVGEVLEAAGIKPDDAERYVEGFATELFRKEMARTLAERLVLA